MTCVDILYQDSNIIKTGLIYIYNSIKSDGTLAPVPTLASIFLPASLSLIIYTNIILLNAYMQNRLNELI